MSDNNPPKRPGVGVGVFIKKDGKFLLGKRLGAHGEATWCTPGGHLEYGESWEACATREVAEETGLKIKNIQFVTLTNDIFEDEHKHYITICMRSDWDSGEAKIMEQDKFTELGWFALDELPAPLFLPLQNLSLTDIANKL
jgi:8-oxo-dGTP diphosphatase